MKKTSAFLLCCIALILLQALGVPALTVKAQDQSKSSTATPTGRSSYTLTFDGGGHSEPLPGGQPALSGYEIAEPSKQEAKLFLQMNAIGFTEATHVFGWDVFVYSIFTTSQDYDSFDVTVTNTPIIYDYKEVGVSAYYNIVFNSRLYIKQQDEWKRVASEHVYSKDGTLWIYQEGTDTITFDFSAHFDYDLEANKQYMIEFEWGVQGVCWYANYFFTGHSTYGTPGEPFADSYAELGLSNPTIEFPEPPPIPSLAVTPVGFDDMQSVLDAMGYSYTNIPTSTLSDLSSMKNYDVIFINCKSVSSPGSTFGPIREFVDQGGAVYASDWAYEYIEGAFPEFADFGGHIAPAQTTTGNIVDAGLEVYLGSDTMTIIYDLGSWVPVTYVSDEVTVYVSNTVSYSGKTHENIPAVIGFKYGKGYVVYTSFHHAAQGELARRLMEYLVLIPTTTDLRLELEDAFEEEGYSPSVTFMDGVDEGEAKSYSFSVNQKMRLIIGVNWYGSQIGITAIQPDGTIYHSESSFVPPIIFEISDADLGVWAFLIEAMEVPYPNYPIVLMVGRSTWNYVFEDSYGRDTTLRINTTNKLFQFITPHKDFGVREAAIMYIYEMYQGTAIGILHEDNELTLYARCVGPPLDVCGAFATDKQTWKQYWLVDV